MFLTWHIGAWGVFGHRRPIFDGYLPHPLQISILLCFQIILLCLEFGDIWKEVPLNDLLHTL